MGQTESHDAATPQKSHPPHYYQYTPTNLYKHPKTQNIRYLQEHRRVSGADPTELSDDDIRDEMSIIFSDKTTNLFAPPNEIPDGKTRPSPTISPLYSNQYSPHIHHQRALPRITTPPRAIPKRHTIDEYDIDVSATAAAEYNARTMSPYSEFKNSETLFNIEYVNQLHKAPTLQDCRRLLVASNENVIKSEDTAIFDKHMRRNIRWRKRIANGDFRLYSYYCDTCSTQLINLRPHIISKRTPYTMHIACVKCGWKDVFTYLTTH